MSLSSRGHAGSARVCGFTLVEMLVTMVISAMLLTLVWQAIAQAMRVEVALQKSGTLETRDFMRREWVRALVATAVHDGRRTPFLGGPRTIAFTSTEAFTWGTFPSGRVELNLEESPDRRAIDVVLSPSGPRASARLVLARWPLVGEARFQFLDRGGDWVDEWPMANGDGGRLPRAVRIVFSSAPAQTWFVEIEADEPPRGLLADWERQ